MVAVVGAPLARVRIQPFFACGGGCANLRVLRGGRVWAERPTLPPAGRRGRGRLQVVAVGWCHVAGAPWAAVGGTQSGRRWCGGASRA